MEPLEEGLRSGCAGLVRDICDVARRISPRFGLGDYFICRNTMHEERLRSLQFLSKDYQCLSAEENHVS